MHSILSLSLISLATGAVGLVGCYYLLTPVLEKYITPIIEKLFPPVR